MKYSDVAMLVLALIAVFLLVFPPTHDAFFSFTDRYYLFGGFIKFFLFATGGDLLSHRIRAGDWRVDGLFLKAMAWGVLGVFISLVFIIFPAGVDVLQVEGLLPDTSLFIVTPLLTSVLMNLLFAPTLMLTHRVSDEYIEMRVKKNGKSLKQAIDSIDFSAYFSMLFRTIPLFWIPAHTVTFILPETFRPLFAALLGVMLGLFLNLFKRSASS